MTGEKKKNPGASVRQRLLNLSKERGDAFDLVLVRYALERLLYRLSSSAHGKRFMLKGALLFHVWGQDDHRPTRDADLLGSGASDAKAIAKVFGELCAMAFEDGIVFDPSSVKAEEIAEDKLYSGLRVTLAAELDGARIPVQVDVGFGDAVTPAPETVRYPTLLDFPAPELAAYPVYTVISEKFHAMVVLGEANSRMKDFYDLWAIARRFELDGELLAEAIKATFKRLVKRNRLHADDVALDAIQNVAAALALEPTAALREGRRFDFVWEAGGPWTKKAKSNA